MAKGKIDGWVILVVLLVLYAIPGIGFQSFVNGIFSGLGGTEDSETGGIEIPCPIEDTTVTFTSNDKYALNTDVTNGSHRVFVNGIDKGYKAEDGTMTVAPGDHLMVIFGENSTSHYSVILEEDEIPCSGTYEAHASLAAYENTPSITIWTEEGQVQSSTANAQAMDTDTVYNNPIRAKVTSKQSWGNPDHPGKGNMVCFQYNSTIFDSVEVDGGDKAYVPNEITSASGKKESCWYVPVVANDPQDGNDGEWNGEIVSDTTSTTPGTGHNISVYFVDTALDLDADTLELIFDVEDEDNNALGATTPSATTFYIS